MPSQRRVKVFAVLAAVVLLVLFYTHTSSQASDREFYDKTVKGMNDRAASQADTEAKLKIQNMGTKEDLQAAAEKSRLEGIEAEHNAKEALLKPKAKPAPAPAPKAAATAVAGTKWDTGDKPEDPKAEEKTEEEKDVEAELNSILKRSPIIIFSKSYCPYSKKAKSIFEKYHIMPAPHIVELDEHKLGSQLQDQLQKLTGRRTVPNVLVSGQSIGGGDDIGNLHEMGDLIKKIQQLGGKRIMEIELKKV